MAVISKIRSYSGLVIIVIGVALFAFILGDLMGYGPAGRQEMLVGEVDRHKVTYPEFETRALQQSEMWKQQTGSQSIGATESFHIRQQVWSQFLREILLANEFDALGIAVSTDELTDLIIGTNPHPLIVQNFTNPADGTFDQANVINFIQNLNSIDPAIQEQWFQLEDFIKQQRLEAKYHTLIRMGIYHPDILAMEDYNDRNATANIRLVAKRFTDFTDSLTPLSERQLRAVYNEHKHRFKQEKGRDLEYVIFPIFPSEADRESVRLIVEGYKQELSQTDNVELFVNSVSDSRFNPSFVAEGELSPAIDSIMFNSPIGTIYGPFVDQNSYVVAKLTDIAFRPDSMKASHILITHQQAQTGGQPSPLTLEQARVKADSILNVVRVAPARFAALASELSDDPSAASNQGDLGWFAEGDMVPQFNDAVLNTAVNNFVVAESDFGFHVIHVTGKSATSKRVQVSKVTREIEYSNATYQQVFGQANEFASLLRDGIDFDIAADSLMLSKRVIDGVLSMDNNLPGVENPRSVIQWAFADRTEEGTISQIFDLDDKFVVARVAGTRKEGIPSLDEIRAQIEEIARQEQRGQLIADMFNEAGASLDAKSTALNVDITEITDLRFMQNTLQGFGLEPKVIGAVFATPAGSTSQPIIGNAGVFVVEVTSKSVPQQAVDLESFKLMMQSAIQNRVEPEVFRAIQESADIKDYRHRFF